jgi:hypothetical protein
MPRTTSLVCSGICLLLTTVVFAQAPLPRHPTHQQVVGYTLQQQQAWHHRQLPANSVLFKSSPNYSASHAFLHHRSLMDLPAYDTPYGFSIKQAYPLYPDFQSATRENRPFSFLKLYLAKERTQYSSWLVNQRWLDPLQPFGSLLLRDLIIPSPQETFQRKYP